MATKTITITTDAYERLAAAKVGNESFSEVINRIAAPASLRDLIGTLSKKQAEELERTRDDIRTRWEARRRNA